MLLIRYHPWKEVTPLRFRTRQHLLSGSDYEMSSMRWQCWRFIAFLLAWSNQEIHWCLQSQRQIFVHVCNAPFEPLENEYRQCKGKILWPLQRHVQFVPSLSGSAVNLKARTTWGAAGKASLWGVIRKVKSLSRNCFNELCLGTWYILICKELLLTYRSCIEELVTCEDMLW